MLFFQYWTAFISSILLTYTLLNFMYKFGGSEWALMNILVNCIIDASFENTYYSFYYFIGVFIIGLLIKLGFTPFHLYKIEVYKGLPLLTIFFYTTYYFLIFFLFFCVLLVIYMNAFSVYSWLNLTAIISVGCLYAFSLLFDINYIKSFFAYSTIINSLGFTCLTVATIR